MSNPTAVQEAVLDTLLKDVSRTMNATVIEGLRSGRISESGVVDQDWLAEKVIALFQELQDRVRLWSKIAGGKI